MFIVKSLTGDAETLEQLSSPLLAISQTRVHTQSHYRSVEKLDFLCNVGHSRGGGPILHLPQQNGGEGGGQKTCEGNVTDVCSQGECVFPNTPLISQIGDMMKQNPPSIQMQYGASSTPERKFILFLAFMRKCFHLKHERETCGRHKTSGRRVSS